MREQARVVVIGAGLIDITSFSKFKGVGAGGGSSA